MYQTLFQNLTQLASDLENRVADAETRVPEVLGSIYALTREDVTEQQVHTLQREIKRVQAALAEQRLEVIDEYKASRKKASNVRRFANLSSPLRAQRLRKRA